MKLAAIISSTVMCGVAALASDASHAQERVIEQRVVSYADLNLNHPKGVETLYSRIRGASRAVCAAAIGRDPLMGTERRDCTRAAIAGAVADVNDPRLTDFYSGRSDFAAQRMAQR